MKISKNAMEVLKRRYLIKDAEGQPTETVEGMFRRVARAVAAADTTFDSTADTEATADRFYTMMTELDFLPNSPTLMNAGKELGQLSACFVLPVGDSMEEIFEAVKQAALIHKSGGGTGFSFSRLRQAGAMVRSTGGVASGPISFMRVFNMATEAVKQGGTRRGANMGILRVDHPDILAFIDCKKDNADITNFNISVGITEAFMLAVEQGQSYALIDPATGKTTNEIDAREVFARIVEGAWHNGEPGIVFLDRLNRDNVVPGQGEIESTNPCGEQPLLPYESCNLGSINLMGMLKATGTGFEIDYPKLEQTVADAVHFLDNVIEINKYPLDKIEETTKLTRKIGLGVMGFADMLIALGVGYNTEAGVALGEKVMAFIADASHRATIELGRERGAFPLFARSTLAGGEPYRNATTTTIAPTGTISIIAGASSGIEPVFAYVYIRNVMDGTRMIEVHPMLRRMLEENGLYSDELMQRIAEAGSLAHIDDIPDAIKKVFVCSHDVSPYYHIKMQAAFQKYTDNAVSKTVNFPHEATQDDVRAVFMMAYEQGCKGVTIYRDGSREGQVLSIGKVSSDESADIVCDACEVQPMPTIYPRPRPEVTFGVTERMKIGCGNLYVTVNYDENGICEVFTSTGKAGGCPSQSEATARLTSVALRSGVALDEILAQLRGIRCPSTIRQAGMKCTSCPDAIARVIKRTAEKMEKDGIILPKPVRRAVATGAEPEAATPIPAHAAKFCPECGERLEHEGGCVSCRGCGYSKCN